MVPELRLVRYFLAVAQEGNVTRAAERLHLSQPSLSSAVKQLERQLGVTLLERAGREIRLTPAGEVLQRSGTDLLEHAAAVFDAVRERGGTVSGRLRLGLSPTARYGVGPQLLAACAAEAPAVMLYTSEDTTGSLLRDVARARLDLAVVFCAPRLPSGLDALRLRCEPAVVHVAATHPLAARDRVSFSDLADETVLVAATRDSAGFTERVLEAFEQAGVRPRTTPDPYPDLGLQAVREGIGVVIYVRSAFPTDLEGSVFLPIEPATRLPFDLVWRSGPSSPGLAAVLAAARRISRGQEVGRAAPARDVAATGSEPDTPAAP